MQSRIKDQIREYLVRNLLSGDARGFTDETELQESRILDSFATLELIHFLEDTFGIALGASQVHAESFRNVDSIARTVETAIAEPSG